MNFGEGVKITAANDSASVTIKGLSGAGGSQALVLGDVSNSEGALVLGSNLTNALDASVKQVVLGDGQQSVSVSGNVSFAQSVSLNTQRLDMANDTELVAAGDVRLSSGTGMSLSAIKASGHAVVIEDQGAQVSAVGSGVNVTADSVSFTGWGPAAGSGGQALTVDAASVRVYAPSGMVLRDTGTDGRVTYLVVSGDQVQQQLVSVNVDTAVTPQQVATTAPTTATRMLTAASAVSTVAVAPASLSGSWTEAPQALTGELRLADVAWRDEQRLAATQDLSGGADVVSLALSDGGGDGAYSEDRDLQLMSSGSWVDDAWSVSDRVETPAYTLWTDALSV
jgi:hypothetical protein